MERKYFVLNFPIRGSTCGSTWLSIFGMLRPLNSTISISINLMKSGRLPSSLTIAWAACPDKCLHVVGGRLEQDGQDLLVGMPVQ